MRALRTRIKTLDDRRSPLNSDSSMRWNDERVLCHVLGEQQLLALPNTRLLVIPANAGIQ